MKCRSLFFLLHLLAVITCLLVSSCSTVPTAEELSSADFGEPIEQTQAEDLAAQFLMRRLKDPMSAQCMWAPVKKDWFRHAVASGGRVVYGYILEAQVNARNEMGGYTGFKKYTFIFRNGMLTSVYGDMNLSPNFVTHARLL